MSLFCHTKNTPVSLLLKRLAGVFALLVSILLLAAAAIPASAQRIVEVQVGQDNSSYVLGTNDVISISVYDEVDLSFEEIRIGDTGNITYPFLGDVKASGQTLNQLEQTIRRRLIEGEFLIAPIVTVTIVEYRPFYIDGEVEKPGSYPYEPGLTLRKAVSIAGGFTERASRSNITIHDAGIAEDEEPRTAANLDITVRPGDVITVKERFF